MALARLYVMALVALTLVAACLWLYWREGVREEAAARWEVERPPLPRDTFQQIRWRERQPAAIRRLAVWVYGAPLAAMSAALWFFNEA